MLNLIAPISYWILTILWLVILWLYITKLRSLKAVDEIVAVLLLILAVDAFRTLFESVYFGLYFNSLFGLLPKTIYEALSQPSLLIIPKLINVVAGLTVLFLLIRRWLPREIHEREEMIKKTQKNEERFTLAMQAANDGLWDWDLQTDDVYYSPYWKSMLGYAEDEIKSNVSEFEQLLHPDDKNKWSFEATAFINGETKKYEVEFRLQHKDGHYVDILSRAFAVKDDEGVINRLIGTHIDITEHKQVEEALQKSHSELELRVEERTLELSKVNEALNTDIIKRKDAERVLEESENRYRRLVEQTQDDYFIYSHNKNGVFQYVSPSVQNILGYEADDFLTHFSTYLTDNPINREAERLTALGIKGELQPSYELEILHKNGNAHILEISEHPIFDPSGQVVSVDGIAHDISQRKHILETLRTSELQKSLILRTVPVLIWLKDAEGVYLACNPLFERFFGAKEAEIVGKSDYDFVDVQLADEFRHHDKVAMEADQPSVNEEWITFTDDGCRALLETTKTPLKDDEGLILGILGIGHDITERKEAEEKIKHLAMTDSLTGLANRTQFDQRLLQSMKLANREGKSLALMMIDLDNFKPVNDTFGHPAGDALLQAVASIFTKFTRETDVVARLGGDEFAILVVHPEKEESAGINAQRIIDEIKKPITIIGNDIRIGASIGIALYPKDANDQEGLLKKADLALYETKESVRGTFTYYRPEMNS